jgi:immune inhibitor A
MQSNLNSSSSLPKIIGIIVAILVCCSCIAIAAAGAFFYRAYQNTPFNLATPFAPFENTVTPAPTVEIQRTPAENNSRETLETLQTTIVPENNPYDLACRLEAKCNVPKTVQAKNYQIGDREKFWILNSDTASYHQIDATLLYITPHTYFWAEEGTNVNKGDMKVLMDTFENKIYPKDREFFGSELIPGVDNDPHIYMLYAGSLGSNIAGAINSTDEYNPLVEEHSNAHETYILSTTQDLADPYAYATLAHEFVHMIQHATDRNDATWMTEGFAEVGSLINGYYSPGADWLYVQNPDLQLNSWADNNSPDFSAHYGQSFLYLAYFLDRFGEDATKALTANTEDDLTSVDDTLKQLNIIDPQTGESVTADDVFMDWAATLYLKDGNVGDGRYTYHNYSDAPQYIPTNTISNCPQTVSDSVHQYGIDYYTINCKGDHTLQFTGSTVASLLPVDAHSGKYAFWSNKGNESNMMLTHEFDFTNTTSPIKLSYWTWYDIEKDWDYVHVAASTDGQNWMLLKTPSGTDYNPSGASFGWSYTGQSTGWIQEEVDLSQFAGKKVQLRFEYITDAEINGEGFFLDDISIDAINYKSDLEADNGGWDAKGFVRVENILPQTYGLSLIIKGAITTVTRIPLNADQTASMPFSLKGGEEAVLIVTGTTRFTTHPTAYQIEIK